MGAIWEHDSHEVSRVKCLCPSDLPHVHNRKCDIPLALQTLYTLIQQVDMYKVAPCLCIYPNLTLCWYEGWNFNSGNYLFTIDTK